MKRCAVKAPYTSSWGNPMSCILEPGHDGTHQTSDGRTFTTRWEEDMEAGAIG